MKLSIPSIQKHWVYSNPVLLTAMILLLLPLAYLIPTYLERAEHLRSVTTKMHSLHQLMLKKERTMEREQNLLSQISQADPTYLETSIESLPLLETERQKWNIFASHLETNQALKEKISFLEKGQNRFRFSEGESRSCSLFQEIEEKQQSPVDLSEDDLKKVLSLTEGVKIHPFFPSTKSPQLLIYSFELSKKMIPEMKEKVYTLQMQLIKREGTSNK